MPPRRDASPSAPAEPAAATRATPTATPGAGPAGTGLTLRLLNEADLPAYKQLRDTMLAGHEAAFTSDAPTEQQRDAASYRHRLHAQAGGRALFTLGAWIDGTLVGALTCEHESRQKVRHVTHLVGMMVADDHQGRGIGRELLGQALALLRRQPVLEIVTLSVSAGNQAAMALYRRFGFTRYGHLPRALRLSDGRYVAKDLMSLELRTGDDPLVG